MPRRAAAEAAAAAATLAALALVGGCDDLSRFRTDARTVLRGPIVGDEGESFIRRGFAPGTEMDLDFDPGAADRPAGSPGGSAGTLTTSPDPASGERAFDRTPLEPIAPLQHDLLSQIDLPGGGDLRSYVYVVRPERGPLAGRDVMVFVTLLDDGGAEVRAIAGAGDEARGDHYGLFRLRPRAR